MMGLVNKFCQQYNASWLRNVAVVAITLIVVGCGRSVESRGVCGMFDRALAQISVDSIVQFSSVDMEDVNGDGHVDFLVHGVENGSDVISYYLGSQAGFASKPSWESSSPILREQVAAGDVNGDGYSDLILGEGSDKTYATWPPEIFLASSTGLPMDPTVDVSGVLLPVRDIVLEDIDCDSVDDVVFAEGGPGTTVTAYRWSSTGAIGMLGSTGIDGTTRGIPQIFGLGDVNHDGCGDILALTKRSALTSADTAPVAALLLGGPLGLGALPAWQAGRGLAGIDELLDVAASGDIDGDGLDDVLVLAYDYSSNGVQLAYFLGTSVGLSSTAFWQARGAWRNIVMTDVDGDGQRDLFLRRSDNLVEVYLARNGSPPGPSVGAKPDFIWQTAWPPQVGDVDGDGCKDLLLIGGDDDNVATLYSGRQ